MFVTLRCVIILQVWHCTSSLTSASSGMPSLRIACACSHMSTPLNFLSVRQAHPVAHRSVFTRNCQHCREPCSTSALRFHAIRERAPCNAGCLFSIQSRSSWGQRSLMHDAGRAAKDGEVFGCNISVRLLGSASRKATDARFVNAQSHSFDLHRVCHRWQDGGRS